MTDSNDPTLPLGNSGKRASAQPLQPTPSRMSQTRVMWFTAAALLLGMTLGVFLEPAIQRIGPARVGAEVRQGSADRAEPVSVGALGRLMPEDDTTTLALPFASGDARVARLHVREGDRIKKGQLIAELDNLPQRLAQSVTAAAELAAKQAALDQTRSAARLSLAEAIASNDHARAARLAADQELAQVSELAKVGMATRSRLDQAQSMAAQAAANQAKATAGIQRFSSRDPDQQPDVRLAIRNLGIAKAALAQAEQDLAGARVAATLDGTVIAIHVRVGEKPGDRGIATLGNTDRMAAELEVYQTDIRKVALGQPVVLSATSLEAPLTGTVSQIGLEVKRQALLAADPAASIDARVIKIRVLLDKPSSERSRSLTGLQVIAKITAGRA